MSGSNSKGGTLNTLLNYRFTKKQAPKLNLSISIQSANDLSKESSIDSDSQATIPYNSQNSFSNGSDSQETVPYDSQNRQSTISSSPVNSTVNSTTANNISSLKYSPVFKSNVNHNLPQNSESASNQSEKPWISKPSQGIENSANSEFQRIKRPTAENDSDDDTFGKGSGIKVDREQLEKLKDMFPNADVKKLKAALFAYGKNFQRAVEYVRNAERAVGKRPAPEEGYDELPVITASRKRIKMMPQTPSPTSEKEFTLTTSEPNDGSTMDFLKTCFPSKSEEAIKTALKDSGGDVEKASIMLTLNNKTIVKSTSDNSKLMKAVSDQKAKANNSKNQQRDDASDDDDAEYSDDYDSGDSDDSENFDNKTLSEIELHLQFFNEATLEELAAMPGCSKKKAETIINQRRFESWDDLCLKFDTKPLLSGCKEIMRVRNIIHRLMVRCESMSQKMETVVSTLTGQKSQDMSESGSIGRQPELLNNEFSLKHYQLIGLSWLRLMHEQELNGILADEMGLGKTIQAISFIAHLLEEGEGGPHVIIVPSSTIENWLREIQLWCPAIKIIVYYGSQEERRAVRHSIFVDEEDFNVLLTTYNMATGDRVFFKKYQFHYAIFDEGHMLKNMSSLRFQNLMKIVAERRLLLTGTPLQNNLLELMSLLCFVMPEIFQGKTDSLKKMFTMISKSEDNKKSRFESERIAQAKRIMKPFVLRRLKKDVLSQLPKKTEKLIKCSLTESQRQLYDGMVSRYAQEVEDRKDGDTSVGGGVGVFMQFRKVANHPLLVRNLFTDDVLEKMAKKLSTEPSHRERGAIPKLIQEDMSVMNDYELISLCKQYKKYLGRFMPDPDVMYQSGKMEKLDELLPEMKERGDRVLLFSQFTMMLDVFEQYLEKRKHKFIRLDGQTPVPDRLQLIDRFTNEPDIFIFLLSTRAGGLGINLVAANTIILHDIDFNPYNDKQAEDRCHRLGQKREVSVIKLIGEDTVDESMLRCANSKLKLEKDITGADQDEDSEKNKKDVANLLKEVLKQRQKQKAGHASGSSAKDDDVISIYDDESSNESKKADDGMIEIWEDDAEDEL